MKLALPWILLAALITHAGAHCAIAIAIARKHDWRRALAALFLPPLAVLWAWHAEMRTLVYLWGTALAVFALGVAVA